MDNRKPAEVFPPGDFIKEELDARGWTQDDLARILGKPLPTVNQIIKGKRAIIADTATRLAAAFGNSPKFWMNLEATWQLHQQGRVPDAANVRSRARLYDLVPIREMERRGWLRETKTSKELECELLRFLDMRTLNDVPDRASARASIQGKHARMTPAQWAWCRRALQVGRLVHVQRLARSKLPQVIRTLRAMTAEPEEIRHVPKVLADAGVRFVVVEHLSHTKIDGAALWPSRNAPVLAMSMRYARVDYFWFTLLHEVSHILNEDRTVADADILQAAKHRDESEERANKQAAAWLIPPEKLESFIARTTPLYSAQRILNFARRMGVHSGIVVGQLKFRGELDWNQYNRLERSDARSIIQQAAMCDGWGRIAPVSE